MLETALPRNIFFVPINVTLYKYNISSFFLPENVNKTKVANENKMRGCFDLITSLHLRFPCCPQEIAFPKMVASCCRFLCYFCRISRQNQKAMFDHLSYLLENSSVGLGKYCKIQLNSLFSFNLLTVALQHFLLQLLYITVREEDGGFKMCIKRMSRR